MRFIDPDGRDWKTTADKEYADELVNALNGAKKAEWEKGARNFKAYNKALLKGNTEKAARIKAKSEDIVKNINNLATGVSELTEMGNTKDQIFTFNKRSRY